MRKVINYTISQPGRDLGKTFVITELPAAQAEKWAMRAFLALAKSGVDVPANIFESGMAGLAVTGMKALQGLPWELAEPLFDEMFKCIQVEASPNGKPFIRALTDDDIEDVTTRFTLRLEVFKVHTDFLEAAARSQ